MTASKVLRKLLRMNLHVEMLTNVLLQFHVSELLTNVLLNVMILSNKDHTNVQLLQHAMRGMLKSHVSASMNVPKELIIVMNYQRLVTISLEMLENICAHANLVSSERTMNMPAQILTNAILQGRMESQT